MKHKYHAHGLRSVALAILSVLSISTGSVHAAPGQWMPQARLIQNIIVEGNSSGVALVIIENGVQAGFQPDACNSQYNVIDLGTSKGRGLLAVALTAYTTARPVSLALGACVDGRPMIDHLMM